MIIIQIIKNYIKKNHNGLEEQKECVHPIVKCQKIILRINLESLNEQFYCFKYFFYFIL